MVRTFENVKGTYDYLPEKQIIRENIKTTLQQIFQKYGFSPLETPIVCYLDLLASKYSEGADILNEMYKLSDQGKRELGLRYDLTITFCKVISSNPYLPMPFKRYEIGKVFRDGPVKLGRNREFTQCDIDCVGVSSLLAEAEYLTMTEEAFRKLGLKIQIVYNNRKLLSGIILAVFGDLGESQMRKSIMLIDKIEKISHEELISGFNEIGVPQEKVDEMCALLKLSSVDLKKALDKFDGNALIDEGLSQISELEYYLRGTQAERCIVFAPYLARGIDIYTGTVWEIFLEDRSIGGEDFSVSLGGGGRYDSIITKFVDDGTEYPAVGMSFGLDVIYEALRLDQKERNTQIVQLYIIPMGAVRESFAFATELRNRGIYVEIEKRTQKVKKSMNYANKLNIPYVVVIGDNEITSGIISVKNMSTGESYQFDVHDIGAIAAFLSRKDSK